MVRTSLSVILALLPSVALAQGQEFVPIVIDAQKYQQVDDAISQLPMSRQAHVQWQQIWQSLERQAAYEKIQAAAKEKADVKK